MADDIITKALNRIDELNAELRRTKSFVNQADIFEGRPPRFPDLDADDSDHVGAGAVSARQAGKKWQPGELFGKPFSGAVRMILEARYQSAGAPSPASVDDIHDALTAGSFKFDTVGADAQKNGIRISLGKNSQTFVRLPNSDLFGLVDWYGTGGKRAGRRGAGGKDSASDEAAEANDNNQSTSEQEETTQETV